MKTFKYYQDPGHGWLAVKTNLLIILGIADKITQFSYQKGSTTYLEEDQDMSVFMDAYAAKYGAEPAIQETQHSNNSPIRNYPRYKGV